MDRKLIEIILNVNFVNQGQMELFTLTEFSVEKQHVETIVITLLGN